MAEVKLENGSTLFFYDESQPVAGNRYCVQLLVSVPLEVKASHCEDCGDPDKAYEAFTSAHGSVLSFDRIRVRNFVAQHEVPALEHEWELFKTIQLNEAAIPNKYKELMGVAIAGAVRCRYCTLFHTGMAKLNGASDAEIEEAVHFAKSSAGWSTYINGLQIDYEEFRRELGEVSDYVKSKTYAKVA